MSDILKTAGEVLARSGFPSLRHGLAAEGLARAVLDYDKKLREVDAALLWMKEVGYLRKTDWPILEAARAREEARKGERA